MCTGRAHSRARGKWDRHSCAAETLPASVRRRRALSAPHARPPLTRRLVSCTAVGASSCFAPSWLFSAARLVKPALLILRCAQQTYKSGMCATGVPPNHLSSMAAVECSHQSLPPNGAAAGISQARSSTVGWQEAGNAGLHSSAERKGLRTAAYAALLCSFAPVCLVHLLCRSGGSRGGNSRGGGSRSGGSRGGGCRGGGCRGSQAHRARQQG